MLGYYMQKAVAIEPILGLVWETKKKVCNRHQVFNEKILNVKTTIHVRGKKMELK